MGERERERVKREEKEWPIEGVRKRGEGSGKNL